VPCCLLGIGDGRSIKGRGGERQWKGIRRKVNYQTSWLKDHLLILTTRPYIIKNRSSDLSGRRGNKGIECGNHLNILASSVSN
jgi:hypothetical protein